jgi:hypothetical protein
MIDTDGDPLNDDLNDDGLLDAENLGRPRQHNGRGDKRT